MVEKLCEKSSRSKFTVSMDGAMVEDLKMPLKWLKFTITTMVMTEKKNDVGYRLGLQLKEDRRVV